MPIGWFVFESLGRCIPRSLRSSKLDISENIGDRGTDITGDYVSNEVANALRSCRDLRHLQLHFRNVPLTTDACVQTIADGLPPYLETFYLDVQGAAVTEASQRALSTAWPDSLKC